MQAAADAIAPVVESPVVGSWARLHPALTGDFQPDAERHSKFWLKGYELLGALPDKPGRNLEQARAADAILNTGRATREAFLGRHVEAVYAALTKARTGFLRVEQLAYAAADLVPGIVPTRAQVAAQSEKPQRDKDGI